MACDLYCPECGENLGKDKENDKLAYCGRCGEEDIYNPRGDSEDMYEEDIKRYRMIREKKNTTKILKDHIRRKRRGL